ncbi:hypothetical protein GCM10022408_26550 [Hymenobacter fastidiosus]|uniref:DUF2490 domain-containing protein n=1 Tax=Hymenobacter fastidiosus TaxID=486264 RepID=A0ABP7SJ52_9BACT
MHPKSCFLLAAGLLVSTGAAAQQRQTFPGGAALMPEAQLEIALSGNDYLLTSFNLVGATRRYSTPGVEFGQFRVGYEHFWTTQWSGGATVRYVPQGNQGNGELLGLPGIVTPGLLVRHLSKAGPVSLGQRLGLEYALGNSLLGESQFYNRALVRLRLDAEHVFALNRISLRPRLAYEAAAYLRLQRDDEELKERFIDFGNLRGEVGVRLSPSFDLTPWVAFQTAYRNSLPFFDALGNQVSGGKVNYVTPAVGLDLRFTVGAAAAAPERQSLPTQH